MNSNFRFKFVKNRIINQLVGHFKNNISLYIKREDLLHPFISGNKLRKLKYNLLEATAQKRETLLTFGGAYSNHIAAVAYAGFEHNFKTIGIIRGDELKDKIDENPTLSFARSYKMELIFVSREQYKHKNENNFIEELDKTFKNCYLLPEGGTNDLAIKGCEEILTTDDNKFDYICCCIGTTGTITGIINSSKYNQKVIGFPALKGSFLEQEIIKKTVTKNWAICSDYHFGGYGKVTDELILFINSFTDQYQIQLDPVYTGKMMFGIMEMIKKEQFPANSQILAIHSGGLQGIAGMNSILKKKNKTTIKYTSTIKF